MDFTKTEIIYDSTHDYLQCTNNSTFNRTRVKMKTVIIYFCVHVCVLLYVEEKVASHMPGM